MKKCTKINNVNKRRKNNTNIKLIFTDLLTSLLTYLLVIGDVFFCYACNR